MPVENILFFPFFLCFKRVALGAHYVVKGKWVETKASWNHIHREFNTLSELAWCKNRVTGQCLD